MESVKCPTNTCPHGCKFKTALPPPRTGMCPQHLPLRSLMSRPWGCKWKTTPAAHPRYPRWRFSRPRPGRPAGPRGGRTRQAPFVSTGLQQAWQPCQERHPRCRKREGGTVAMTSRLLETNCVLKEGKTGNAAGTVVAAWHCLVAGGEAGQGRYQAGW